MQEYEFTMIWPEMFYIFFCTCPNLKQNNSKLKIRLSLQSPNWITDDVPYDAELIRYRHNITIEISLSLRCVAAHVSGLRAEAAKPIIIIVSRWRNQRSLPTTGAKIENGPSRWGGNVNFTICNAVKSPMRDTRCNYRFCETCNSRMHAGRFVVVYHREKQPCRTSQKQATRQLHNAEDSCNINYPDAKRRQAKRPRMNLEILL